jgi:phosphatidylglycerophosphate synthase
VGDLSRAARSLDLGVAAPSAWMIARAYGPRRAARYATGLAAALAVQHVALRAAMRATGTREASPGDLLTLGRATGGAVLAGLVAAGVRDRAGAAGRLGWLVALLGATLSDWLDGPLSRRAGPTRLGRVLDLEADSWLTLWAAAGAVAWSGLPRWCLLPPLLRYAGPLLDLVRGELPAGGGPRWSRATGTAQMALILVALAPVDRRLRWPPERRRRVLARAAWPISGAQAVTVMVSLARRGQ